jgi:hypothetical protein
MKNNNIAPKVIILIASFRDSIEFRCLNAFVKTTKHMSLVSSRYNIVLKEPEKHGLQFNASTHKKKEYVQKWAEDVINEDYNRIIQMINSIGYGMNEYMMSTEL